MVDLRKEAIKNTFSTKATGGMKFEEEKSWA